jgi:hypothetical protein
MSSEEIDVIVQARENAIATLQAVQAEIRATGTASEATVAAYRDVRQEVMLSQRSLTTLTMAYREQYESVYLAGRAFSDVSAIIGRALNMYEQYNVAMIRTSQLQKEVTTAQEKYSNALTAFGPDSHQAVAALSELTSANNALASAQEKNTAMLVGMAAQIPGFIGPILNAGIAFAVLRKEMEAARVSATAFVASLGLVAVAIGLGALAYQQMSTAVEKFGISTTAVAEKVPVLGDATGTMQDKMTGATTAVKEMSSAMEDLSKFIPADVAALQDLANYAGVVGASFTKAFTGPMAQLGPEMSKSMSDMVRTINTSIREGFVGDAQNLFAQFKNCVSGKMNDLPGMQKQVMDSIVSITNNAINKGLRGTAQEGIALFVQCSQSKQLNMVKEIQGYLTQLADEYKSNAATILTLTSQGKDAEANIYRERNVEIQSIISQLNTWLQATISGKPIVLPIDTTAAQSNVDAVNDRVLSFGEKVAEKKELQLDSSTAQTNVGDVDKKLGEIPKISIATIVVVNTEALANIQAVTSALYGIQDRTVTVDVVVNMPSLGSLFGSLMGYQYGTPYVPETQVAVVHKGEAIIPASQNTGSGSLGRGTVHFENRTYVQVDGRTVSESVERRLIQERGRSTY